MNFRTTHLIRANIPYVSFSGGKDSTVLSDMVARVCQSFHYKMVVVFSDTGLEYPEIRKFVPQYVEFLKKKYSNMIIEETEKEGDEKCSHQD